MIIPAEFSQIVNVVIVLLTLIVFTLFSMKKKALDREGLIVGNIVGIAIYLQGGFHPFLTLIFFFFIADISTRMTRMGNAEKHEIRTTGNIIGNSLPALLALSMNSFTGFYGAMSAALADTLSSELGLLSKKKPVLITTFEKVKAGTDGGITWFGLVAALIGAVFIALVHFYIFQNILLAIIIIIAGLFGSIVDSFFGAVFERKKILTNTHVNFIGSSAGAILAVLLSLVF